MHFFKFSIFFRSALPLQTNLSQKNMDASCAIHGRRPDDFDNLAYSVTEYALRRDEDGPADYVFVPRAHLVTVRSSADVGHGVWEAHMRGLSSDYIEPEYMGSWLERRILWTGETGDVLSVHYLWLEFCQSTSMHVVRSAFGNLLSQVGRGRFRAWPGATCRCPAEKWAHVHGFRMTAASVCSLQQLESDMVNSLARKRFESVPAEGQSPAKMRKTCAK